jgi:hypothetical protein
MRISNQNIETIVYLHLPSTGYMFLSSDKSLEDLYPSFSRGVISFLASNNIRGYFLKSFRSDKNNVNYVAVGWKSVEVDRVDGRAADYVYAYIFKVSDFLKYSVNLKKIFKERITSYSDLYREFEKKGFKEDAVKLKPLSINEIRVEYERDLKLPIIEPREVGYVIHVDSLDSALRLFEEKMYKNMWLRVLFDYVFVENYRESPPPNTIVFSYGTRGEKPPDLFNFSTSFNIEEFCRNLATNLNYSIDKHYPCTILDHVENYRKEIKDYIYIQVIKGPELEKATMEIINRVKSTSINKDTIENINKLCKEFEENVKSLRPLKLEPKYYYSKVSEAFKSNMPKDLYRLIEILEHIQERNIQLCELLRGILEECEKDLDRRILEELPDHIKQFPISDKGKFIVRFVVKKKPSILSMLIEREYETLSHSLEDFSIKYKGFNNICDNLKNLGVKDLYKNCKGRRKRIVKELKEKMKRGR